MKMNKKLDYYISLPYTIQLVPYGDGSYFAQIAELPGCMTEGDTLDETMWMIEDAKKEWISAGLELGHSIPEPETREFSGKFNVRVPKTVHKELVYKAIHEGVSLNTLVSNTLASVVHDRPRKKDTDK